MSSGPVIQLNEKGNGPLLVMPPFLADSDEEESRQTFVSQLKENTIPLGLCSALTQRDGIKSITLLSGSPFYSLHFFTNNCHLD